MTKHPANKSSSQTIEVHTQDFVHHHKNQFWYIGVGILLVAFLILTFSARDYLLMAVVVAAAIAVFRLANLKPSRRQVSISDKGIHWGEQFLGFHSFRAFWLGAHDNEYTIYLDRLNFKPTISFMVSDKEVEPILDLLVDHLPFHAHRNTPLPDRLSRLLRL